MREITSHKVNGVNDALTIRVLDDPGAGGASHSYAITTPNKPLKKALKNPPVQCTIEFQNGPIGEAGPNGVTNEALLAIVADRLSSFQQGPYACPENAGALGHIEQAIRTLHDRTKERSARGVEGTSAK